VATEPNLRHLFDAPQPTSVIDVESVVRRSRARRLPKVLGVTGVSVLAIGGLVFGGVQILGVPAASNTAGSAPAADSPMMSEAGDAGLSDGTKRTAAEYLNLCEAPVAEVTPSPTGLMLSVAFPDAPSGSTVVEGTVTMTNTGTSTLTGYTAAAPVITLAQGGVVLWHSNGPTTQEAREVALAPGESMDYAASFSPVVCAAEDDSRESFRTDLPPASAGQYQVSAAIEFMGDFDAELISGPASTVTLT
jgi:hypothetical protein